MPSLSIVVPTYQREQVLVDTLFSLTALRPAAFEILVVDQTLKHVPRTESALRELEASNTIRWIRLERPSITHAMNAGLRAAKGDVVLFLDDDIRPDETLLAAHVDAQGVGDGLVAGRVVQPWQEDGSWRQEPGFQFASLTPCRVQEFMGGNFSIRRCIALELGGFDENFVRVAYRFEAEFAHRYRATGRSIHFEPRASLHHLKVASGGTRSFGEHLTTWRPDHAVGAYYYGLRTRALHEIVTRPLRAVATRYHLRHPWRVPATLLAEFSGMAWAFWLFMRGPRLLPHS